jgi:NAD(P)H-hydrate epimerase
MPGAARLAAEAALRAGAGLVHAAVAPECVGPVMAGRPEIMCRGVADRRDIADWIDTADVIVLGPGLGRQAWGDALAAAVLASDRPLVVDADGLYYLARHPARRDSWVLTPHPGEAARLLACSTSEVQAHRARSAGRIAENFGGFAVLKGAGTLVAQSAHAQSAQAQSASGRPASAQSTAAEGVPISVCDAGNPGMATGGMGDVLAGLLGGLIAQFGCSRAVVECAVLAHARAGDAAAAAGERGLLASDLFAFLRRELNPS